MCLITYWSEPIITTKDITVYKLVRMNKKLYRSPFKETRILFNKLVYAKTDSGKRVKHLELIYHNRYQSNVEEGLHGYTKKLFAKQQIEDWFCSPAYIVIKMIIPKGAEYFISWHKREIVSNQAIYKLIEE